MASRPPVVPGMDTIIPSPRPRGNRERSARQGYFPEDTFRPSSGAAFQRARGPRSPTGRGPVPRSKITPLGDRSARPRRRTIAPKTDAHDRGAATARTAGIPGRTRDRRARPRVPANLPVLLTAGSMVVVGTTVDASEEGLAVGVPASTPALPLMVRVALRLPN